MEIWGEELKQWLPRYSFVDLKAHDFFQEGKQFAQTFQMDFVLYFQKLVQCFNANICWKTQDWIQWTCQEYYWIVYTHPSSFIRTRILCASYLLPNQSIHNQRIVTDLFQELDHQEYLIQWDIFDVLYRNQAQLSLQQYTSLERWRHDQNQHVPTNKHPTWKDNIYINHQNVHETDIHDSILSNIEILHDEYWEAMSHKSATDLKNIAEHADILNKTVHYLESHDLWNSKVDRALQRMLKDPSFILLHDTTPIVLMDLWTFILFYIEQHSSFDLWKRVQEELMEAQGTCFTGHATRLVNILIGFHPKIELTIDDSHRRQAILQQILQKHLKNDDILLDMIDPILNGPLDTWIHAHAEYIFEELNEKIPTTWNELDELWQKLFSLSFPGRKTSSYRSFLENRSWKNFFKKKVT